MKHLIISTVIALSPCLSMAQSNEYLWIQSVGDEIIVVATDPSLDRKIPLDIKTTLKAEGMKENQQKAIHALLDVIKEYETQGWMVFNLDGGVWILQRKE